MRSCFLLVSLIVAVALLGAGCGYLTELYPIDDAREVVPSGSVQRHDLAITAVDTDPAWISKTPAPGATVSLLSVVENKGNMKETGILVEASLYNASRDRILLHGASIVSELAPGQSEVVRFGPFSSIPPSGGYVLEIDVKPVPNEDNLANNFRAFQLNP